jgi:hypothetical protein
MSADPSAAAARAWRELGDLDVQAGSVLRAVEAYDRALAIIGIPRLPGQDVGVPSEQAGATNGNGSGLGPEDA